MALELADIFRRYGPAYRQKYVRFGVPARVERLDVLEFAEHAAFAERAARGFGEGVDGLIFCHGEMPPEDAARRDPAVLRHMIEVNYSSTVSLLERAADALRPRGRGFLCALTSVAGDRGRPRNHAYGSSKAAVTAYLEGLCARFAREGLSVVNVEPGVVDTAMTWGLPPGPPRAAAERVARDVLRGIARDMISILSR